MKAIVKEIITPNGKINVPFVNGWDFKTLEYSSDTQTMIVKFDQITATIYIAATNYIYLQINERYQHPFKTLERVFYELVHIYYNSSILINTHFIENYGTITEGEAARIVYDNCYPNGVLIDDLYETLSYLNVIIGVDTINRLSSLDYQAKLDLLDIERDKRTKMDELLGRRIS